MFKMFILFLSALCTIRQFPETNILSSIRNLGESTVVFINTEVMYRVSPYSDWKPLEDPNIELTLRVSYSPDRDWMKLIDSGTYVTEYARHGAKNSFFFTTTVPSYYKFEIEIKDQGQLQYGLCTTIYEGAERDTRIVSNVDTVLKEIEMNIKMAIGACKEISNLQYADAVDEETYKSILQSISRIIFYSVLFKIIIVIFTFYYFNRKMKEFCLVKKVVGK
ncbi:hypothetical protein SLOPH_2337 [Spraguea lophii 42_110]|uniref:GOLD domain-containing protein n=1 Tax=Spraguea lophii (strain 42_110) TaxID=1358809 RepID=S7WAB5_SPRLO|nr:hypothetical protein SLOPH_2337 [Spraguea lophii 42_110]